MGVGKGYPRKVLFIRKPGSEHCRTATRFIQHFFVDAQVAQFSQKKPGRRVIFSNIRNKLLSTLGSHNCFVN